MNKSEKQCYQLHCTKQSCAHLGCGHEEGEDDEEGALGHWQPVSLLHGEEDGSVQARFGWAAKTQILYVQGFDLRNDVFLRLFYYKNSCNDNTVHVFLMTKQTTSCCYQWIPQSGDKAQSQSWFDPRVLITYHTFKTPTCCVRRLTMTC